MPEQSQQEQNQPDQSQQNDFQKRIGYRFKDPALLDLALSHRSWSFEHIHKNKVSASNERLELLGDSVLSMCVLHHAYLTYPNLSEGALSEVRSLTVRASSLAAVGQRYGVGSVLKLGRGEQRGGGRENPRLLGDAVEAIIAAVYLDAGVAAANELVVRMLGDVIADAAAQQGQAQQPDAHKPAAND